MSINHCMTKNFWIGCWLVIDLYKLKIHKCGMSDHFHYFNFAQKSIFGWNISLEATLFRIIQKSTKTYGLVGYVLILQLCRYFINLSAKLSGAHFPERYQKHATSGKLSASAREQSTELCKCILRASASYIFFTISN